MKQFSLFHITSLNELIIELADDISLKHATILIKHILTKHLMTEYIDVKEDKKFLSSLTYYYLFNPDSNKFEYDKLIGDLLSFLADCDTTDTFSDIYSGIFCINEFELTEVIE